MEETTLLSQLINPEDLVSLSARLIQVAIVILIISILRKISIAILEKVLRNRFSLAITQSQHFSFEEKRLNTVSKLLKSALSYSLYLIGIITIMGIFNIPVEAVLASAGILGLAVGFGAQSLVTDIMAGFFIVLENQFAVGEWVKVGTIFGEVEEMGIKSTKIRTFEGELKIVPNGKIADITNYSRYSLRRHVDVGIAYEEDIDHAIEVIEMACETINKRYDSDIDEKAHVLGVINLGASSVDVRVTFTARNLEHWAIERQLRKEVKNELKRQGVEISYSKLVVIAAEQNEEVTEAEVEKVKAVEYM